MASDGSFKDWLKQRRKSLDLTQAELAHKVSCSIYTVQRIEEGVARPSRQLAELLAAGLEIPPEERAAFVQRARAAMARSAIAAPPGPIVVPEPTNPYKGLHAFQEADAPDFFGRETLTQRLCERLNEETELSRFLAVVGPSGAGKSSIARAGLIPALRRQALPGGCTPVVVDFSPGTHPLEELEAGLLRVAVNPPPSLIEQLRADERGLARAIKRVLPGDDTSELVLLIDQFEELFTMVPDERARADFINSLFSAVADARSRLRVVITLRADFYDRPLLYLPASELFGRRTEVVGPLAADEMERAITGPAERHGLELERGLVTAIMQDVAEQPGTLPLMEYALTELYERRAGRLLTLAAYQASGGVFGALARRAESLYAGLSVAEQAEVRQLFLRLITPGEGVDDTRRRVLLSELRSAARDAAVLQRVLDLYGRYRMLTFDRDRLARAPTVEVAHEALVRSWGRLGEWLAESRERLLLQRRMMFSSAEWQRSGRESSFLASGARLVQFAGLEDQADATGAVALTAAEQEYIAASLQEQQRVEAAERERQAREASLQKRAASRLRYLVAGLALFLLVAAGLAVWALNRSQLAQDNFTHADVLRLAAEANNLLSSHGPSELVALLSIRSLTMQYSPQADAELSVAASLNYPVRRFSGHTDDVWNVDFSPDGKYLLTASLDKTARLWDVTSGQMVRIFAGHTASVNNAVFSPDGKLIATSSDDGTARIWAVDTGKTWLTIAQSPVVLGVTFSPDGKYLLTNGDHTARLWDVATGQEVPDLPGNISVFAIVKFSPDAKYIAGSGNGNDIQLWDAATGQQLRTLPQPAEALTFSRDGKYLLTGGDDQIARLWDIKSGQMLQVFAGHTGAIKNVAYSPDGTTVLTSSDDHTARLWDIKSGQLLQMFADHADAVFGIAFSPDGKWLATTSSDNTALLWHVQPARDVPQFIGHTDAVWGAAFSPDGTKIATASNDRTARVWDAASGKELLRLVANDAQVSDVDSRVNSAVFSPDSRTVLTASGDHTARLWDAATGKELLRFTGHTDMVNRALFSADGRRVVTVSSDGTARVWDAATGKELTRFEGHTGPVFGVAFSPDGKLVVTSGNDTTARIWDSVTGKELQVLRGHTDVVKDVAFSPDGKEVLTASSDGSAGLWDVASGKELRRFLGHNGAVYAAAFSRDGAYVLTGGSDQTARLWDAQSGQELRRFTGHSGEVQSVAFSPDGKFVLTASNDSTARLWQTDYHDTIRDVCRLLTRDLTPDERAHYGIADDGPTCRGY